MEQDGRVETSPPSAASRSTDAHEDWTVLMTLYTAPTSGTALRHATVPFPESYEAGCQQAIKSFAAYIPKDTETVSLRRAHKKLDGNVVWSAVHEDDWSVVLKKSGEEIGVFLPEENPDGIPYGPPPEKLVRMGVFDSFGLVVAVSSFEQSMEIARAVFKAMGNEGIPKLMFDGRMLGNADRQAAYRRESDDTASMVKNAHWEEIRNRALFKILVDMNPEPLIIKIM